MASSASPGGLSEAQRVEVERLATLASRNARALQSGGGGAHAGPSGGYTALVLAPGALEATQAALRELVAARATRERAPVEYLRHYAPSAPFYKQLDDAREVLAGCRALQLRTEGGATTGAAVAPLPTSLAPFEALKWLLLARLSLAGSGPAALSALRPRLEALALERCTALEGSAQAGGGGGGANDDEGVGALGRALLCGAGEGAAAGSVEWPALASLRCSKCGLTRLTAGVRTAPRLTRLDLSWNSLERVDALACLTCLASVKLSFNRLSSLRGLEASAGTLLVLEARGNALQSVGSVLPLARLAALDLAGNVLADATDVIQLGSLGELRSLCLEANPVAHASQYRTRTLQLFSGRLVSLDGVPPTAAEAVNATRSPFRGGVAAEPRQRRFSPGALPDRLAAWRRGSLRGGEVSPLADGATEAAGPGLKGRRGRKGRRPRVRTIVEADECPDSPSKRSSGGKAAPTPPTPSSPATSASPLQVSPIQSVLTDSAEADTLREQAEEFKRQKGVRWLSSFNDWLERRIPSRASGDKGTGARGAGGGAVEGDSQARTPPEAEAALAADLEQLLSSARSSRPHAVPPPRSASPPRFEDAVLRTRSLSSGYAASPAGMAGTPTMSELVARGDSGSDSDAEPTAGRWLPREDAAASAKPREREPSSARARARWGSGSDTSDTTSASGLDSDEGGDEGARMLAVEGIPLSPVQVRDDHIALSPVRTYGAIDSDGKLPTPPRIRGRAGGLMLTLERLESEASLSQAEKADVAARRAAVRCSPQSQASGSIGVHSD